MQPFPVKVTLDRLTIQRIAPRKAIVWWLDGMNYFQPNAQQMKVAFELSQELCSASAERACEIRPQLEACLTEIGFQDIHIPIQLKLFAVPEVSFLAYGYSPKDSETLFTNPLQHTQVQDVCLHLRFMETSEVTQRLSNMQVWECPDADSIATVLHRLREAGIPFAIRACNQYPERLAKALDYIDSPTIVPAVSALRRSDWPGLRDVAQAWIRKYPQSAATLCEADSSVRPEQTGKEDADFQRLELADQVERWITARIQNGDLDNKYRLTSNLSHFPESTHLIHWTEIGDSEAEEDLEILPARIMEAVKFYTSENPDSSLETPTDIDVWKVSIKENRAYVLITIDGAGNDDMEGSYECFDGSGSFLSANFWGQRGSP